MTLCQCGITPGLHGTWKVQIKKYTFKDALSYSDHHLVSVVLPLCPEQEERLMRLTHWVS